MSETRVSVSPFDHLVQQRRLDDARRALHARGWEQRLQPLATRPPSEAPETWAA